MSKPHQFLRSLHRAEPRLCSALFAAMLVFSLPASAAEPQRLTMDGRVKRNPVLLNPSGTELLYVLHDKPNRLRLMKLSLKDGQSTPLHPDETRSEFEPAVSVDGRYLAYVQNRGNLSLAMVVHDLIENKITELPPGGGFSGMHSPTFTRDNSQILFSYPEDGRQSIFSVDLDCKNRQTVVASAGVNNWPHCSSDGKRLVFSSTRDDDYELYVSNVDGSHLQRLTTSPKQDIRPKFSPDGSRIAFTSGRDGNYNIYVMGTDGNNLTPVTTHAEHDDYAAWHPDGKHLIVVSERSGQFDLFLVPLP